MKKLLVALLALSAVSAFAHNHEGKNLKHMVRFYDFNDAGVSGSFDVAFDTKTDANGTKDNDTAGNNIALNYAYAINNNWQVGGTYKNNNVGSGDTTTVGLSGYYNAGKSLDSTCYYGLHYDMKTDKTTSNDIKTTTIGLEYGHRFHVGHVWGLHLTYSPSLVYSMSTTDYDNDAIDEDQKTQALAWNWIKFDVLF
jgi:hypothetical protein